MPPAEAAAPYTFKRGLNISHWLSQNYGERSYGADWFGEKDMQWIADQGFDHVRIPVDFKYWRQEDGSLNEAALVPFDQACAWARKRGLGVVLDVHYLPGTNFTSEKNALYTDDALIQKSAYFWEKVAAQYADAGPWLRFELLNEPVADNNADVNALMAKLLAAVRKTNPTRIVYITSNRWSSFDTVGDVVLPNDPNVALTLHFYQPFIFTHQSTNWTQLKPPMPQIKFPGVVPELPDTLPAYVRKEAGEELSAGQSIDPKFDKLAEWHLENAPALEIYIGEYGAYQAADADSIRNYYAAVVEAAESRGFGTAAWDYQGGFGVRAADGGPSPAMEGILEGRAAAEASLAGK